MNRDGILIMVILCLIIGGYLAVREGYQHNIREGLTGWWNIKNEQDCTAAGSSDYASCSADGTQYCAGPCTGPGHKCMVPQDPQKVAEFKQAWEEREIIRTGGILSQEEYKELANQEAAKVFPTKWNGLQWFACINPGPPSRLGNPHATTETMNCPPEYPYLLEYANGDKYCYENSDGNTTGQGGLCNCDCLDCGFNSSFPNCTELGSEYGCQTCNYLFKKGPNVKSNE